MASSTVSHHCVTVHIAKHVDIIDASTCRFIKSVLNITKALNLDGFDVDWEFPAWLGADDREKIHFVQLLQELRKEFDRSGQRLILTVAVAAPQAIVDQSYIVPAMAEYVYQERCQ